MDIILEADQQHHKERLIQALNYIGDLEEYYTKKFGQDSKYTRKAAQTRQDVANYHGLNDKIINHLKAALSEKYNQGYQSGLTDSEPSAKLRYSVVANSYRECSINERKRAKTIQRAKTKWSHLY